MKLGVGIVCFIQDITQLPELERCLNSVKAFDKVIIVDGKWSDIKAVRLTSIPEAITLIHKYNNTMLVNSSEHTEAHNRDLYLQFAGDLDYMFTLDTDEYVEMPLGRKFFESGIDDIFAEDGHCSQVHGFSVPNGGVCKFIRFIKDPSSKCYKLKHNELYMGDVNIYEHPLNAPRGMIIHHDKSFRLPIQKEQMNQREKDYPIH